MNSLVQATDFAGLTLRSHRPLSPHAMSATCLPSSLPGPEAVSWCHTYILWALGGLMLLTLPLLNKYPHLPVFPALGLKPGKPTQDITQAGAPKHLSLASTSLPEEALHGNIAADDTSPEITGSYTARCEGKSDPLAAGASCCDTGRKLHRRHPTP